MTGCMVLLASEIKTSIHDLVACVVYRVEIQRHCMSVSLAFWGFLSVYDRAVPCFSSPKSSRSALLSPSPAALSTKTTGSP